MTIDETPPAGERTPAGVTCDAAEPEVIIRGGLRSGTGTVLSILAGAIGIGLLFAFFSPRPEAIPRAAPALLIAATAALACWAALEVGGRERLFVGDDEVVYERHFAMFRWDRRSVSRRERIDLRMETRGGKRGIIVAAGSERWHIGRALDAAAIQWVHAWLVDRLERT